MKTDLSMALPSGCYGRVAPRSGLALQKFIDVGAGVIDSDYRGELGAILFNFCNEDFVLNQGDKVAQLIFEKIKTPTVKEVDSLEETGRGDRGYGSTGISGSQSDQLKTSRPNQNSYSDQAVKTQLTNESAQRQSQLSQARQIISARQIQKLAKDDNPVFLAVIRSTNEAPRSSSDHNHCAAPRCTRIP